MKKFLAAAVAATVIGAIGVMPVEARYGSSGASREVPKLLEPHETVQPQGSATVKFRWSGESMPGDTHRYDDLRIFRGNQAYADAMIFSKEVTPGQGWAEVPSDLLSQPGVYCWTVKRVGVRSKSRNAFSVFKV